MRPYEFSGEYRTGNTARLQYIIAVTSITYATKGQNLLQHYGYRCSIQRTPKNFSTGCGYCLRVEGDINRILGILKNGGVRVKDTAALSFNSGNERNEQEYKESRYPFRKG